MSARRGDTVAVLPHGQERSVAVQMPEGAGVCLKQVVVATVVAPDGRRFAATNHRFGLVPECPRAGVATGTGYEFCRDVCRQPAHAEVNALRLAGEAARGGVLLVEGHSYACDSCLRAAREAGISRVEVGGRSFKP